MAHYSIGELSRRTGLTVKAIRFYADRGIVPATRRNTAGHRVYDEDAAARLALVRSLRDLGVDLATIRRVLAREVTVADVAAAHAGTLDVTIRALRFRRAALSVIARADPEEWDIVNRLAAVSEDERRRLVDEFLTETFAGLGDFAGVRRSLTPELPDDPTATQLEAWVELVALTQDPGFRAHLRALAAQHAADRGSGGVPRPEAVAVVRTTVPPGALTVPADSVDAGSIVASVVAAYTAVVGVTGEPPADRRARLLARVELANDPGRERYEHLLSVVNGWPPEEPAEPVLTWFSRALRANMAG